MKRKKLFEIVNEEIGENIYTSTKNLYWNELLPRYKLSEKFIEKYRLKFDGNLLYNYQLLSLNYINKYFMYDKIYSEVIVKNQKLNSEFIEKFKDELNWNYISCYQLLSEDFIEKYKDKVNWSFILLNQPFINKEKIIFNKNFKNSLSLTLLDNNYLYKQYKKGKDWFIGCIPEYELNNNLPRKVFTDEYTINKLKLKTVDMIKIKIYWNDLITTNSTKEVYPIRKIKFI